jgi:hypothetical protein
MHQGEEFTIGIGRTTGGKCHAAHTGDFEESATVHHQYEPSAGRNERLMGWVKHICYSKCHGRGNGLAGKNDS